MELKDKTMKEQQYKTKEQFLEIVDTMENGNHTQAALSCIEYGFYADNLQHFYESLELDSDIWDFVQLAELAERLRAKE